MMTRILPGVAVIIGTRNRPALLSDAVAAVLEGNAVPEELVIVDQSDWPHSELGGPAYADRTPVGTSVKYIWSRERGLARGRNQAIRATSRPILAFTDDDCIASPTWLETLTSALEQGGTRTVVTGRVLAGGQETDGAFAPSLVVDEEPREYVGRIDRDVLFNNNVALFRTATDEIGYYDVRLGPGGRFDSSDDNDFGFRLLEAGYRIRYVPGAVVTHRAWRGSGDLLRLRWMYGRGQGGFFAKHLDLDDRFMLDRLYATLGDHLRRIRHLVRRRPREAVGEVVYVVGMLGAFVEWLLTQRRVS